MLLRLVRKIIQIIRLKRDPIGFARSLGVQIGKGCRMAETSAHTWGSEPYLVKLGDGVTVADSVRFVTHDGGVQAFRAEHPELDVVGPIVVGNNVFLGYHVTILPGVTIGDDCVIGAFSLVGRDVPPRSVVAGIPARVIKSLDDYKGKAMERALRIHTLPREEKRAFLLDHFKARIGR